MSIESTYQRYAPSLNTHGKEIFHREDVAAASEFLAQQTDASVNAWTQDHTKTFTTPGGRNFRMIVDRPKDGDPNSTLVYAAPFLGGANSGAVALARFVRDTAAPEAALIIQPNDNHDQNWMNFGMSEILGDTAQAYVDRLAIATKATLGKMPERTALFGVSSGASLAYKYAAGNHVNVAEVTGVESPNGVDRNLATLGANFLVCCKELEAVMLENFDDPEVQFAKEWQAEMKHNGRPDKVLRGFIRPSNAATILTFRHETVRGYTKAILDKGNVVTQVTGDVDNVAPLQPQLETAAQFINEPGFDFYVLNGSDHSVGLTFAPMAALVRDTRHRREALQKA